MTSDHYLPLDPIKDLSVWQDELSRASSDRETRETVWELCLDAYTMRYTNPRHATKGGEIVRTGLIKSTVDILFSSTSLRRPKLLVSANRAEDEASAEMSQALVNHWWRRLEIHPEFRSAWLDCLIFGTGWLKTGWHEETEMRRGLPPPPEEVERIAAQAEEISAAVGVGSQVASDERRRNIAEKMRGDAQEVVTRSHPVVERISPFDVWVDPDSQTIRDAKWVCQRMWRTIDQVRADDTYAPQTQEPSTPTEPGSRRSAPPRRSNTSAPAADGSPTSEYASR